MARGQSLYDWCMENGERGQQLLYEFGDGNNSQQFYDEETGMYKSPQDYSRGSHTKIKWTCNKKHIFYSAPHSRTGGTYTNCNICAGVNVKKITEKRGRKNLYDWCMDNNNEILISEWLGIDNHGFKISMKEFTYGSHALVQWKCKKCGYIWTKSINQRTCGQGCPVCASKVVTNINSLETWCNKNGSFGEELKAQWTGFTDENKPISINDISFASNISVIWKCDKGHNWSISPNQRTSYKTHCPKCNSSGTSYPEQFIYWSLRQIYSDAESRCRVLRSTENPSGIEFDIGIPSIPLCVEYSPTRWHKNKNNRDIEKANICKKYNVKFIYIKEDSYNEYEEVWKNDYICFHMDENNKEYICTKLVRFIVETLGHNISEIDFEQSKKKAFEYSHGKLEDNNTLECKYPELYKEWNHSLNSIKPDSINTGSHQDIFWTCNKCGYGKNGEWIASLNRRTAKGQETGCPKCGWHWKKQQYVQKLVNKTDIPLSEDEKYKYITYEWNNELNELCTSDVTFGSKKEVHWKCTNCGYGANGEWFTQIRRRIYFKSGCPQCGYNWYKAQTGQPQKLKKGYTLKIQPKSEVANTNIPE